jgi:FkbM family methyltransferase
MTVQILNFFHKKGYRRLLASVAAWAYRAKGYRNVKTKYHPELRAYEYQVDGTTFLSTGPGWAYSHAYLANLLRETFCNQYWPQAGDCVIDIGAGFGEETVVYATLVGPQGKVHALEANPVTYAGLKYVCDQNHFYWAKPYHLAVYKTDGEVTIEDDEENYLVNTINTSSATKHGSVVKAVTLDTLVRENGITRIDLLKANIEGAEKFLIEGMNESIRLVRHACISCHDFRHVYHNHGEFYMTKQQIVAFFEAHGFEVTIRNTGNHVTDDYVYARNIR